MPLLQQHSLLLRLEHLCRGSGADRKSPSVARVFQLAEQRRAERVAEQAAERGPHCNIMLRGCSWEALLSDVRFVRVHAQCLCWLDSGA